MVYINDNNCAPAGVTDLWDLDGPTGGGTACATPATIPGYMATVEDPFASGTNYGFGSDITGVSRAWGSGSDGSNDSGTWDGVVGLTDDDLGNSSQTGCVKGSASVIPSGIC